MSQAGWQKRGKTTGGTQLGNTGALDVKTFLTQYGLEGFESAERHEASDSAQASEIYSLTFFFSFLWLPSKNLH